MLLAGGSDGNLHVLSKRGQEFHQPANWKTPGPVAHEQGDVRLFDAERHGGFGLRHIEAKRADSRTDEGHRTPCPFEQVENLCCIRAGRRRAARRRPSMFYNRLK